MTVHAVIRDRGKQYQVAPGQKVHVDRLAVEPGQEVALGEVLLLSDGSSVQVGAPIVEGARVLGRVLAAEVKDRKVRSFRFHRRKNVRTVRGHRQRYTLVEVTRIETAPAAEASTPAGA